MNDAGDIFCIGCGYDLRQTRERCPECGRAFDPAVIGSVARHVPPGRLTRAMLRPLGWPSMVLVGASSVGMLWTATNPAFYYQVDAILIPMWILALATAYLVRCVVGGASAFSCGLPGYYGCGGRRGGYLAVAVVLTTLLLVAGVPLRIGFLTALPRLQALTSRTIGGRPLFPYEGRAGIYEVKMNHLGMKGNTEADPRTVVFYIEGQGEPAFVLSPVGERGFYATGDWGHLWGDWYWRVWD